MICFVDTECSGIDKRKGCYYNTFLEYDIIELAAVITDDEFNIKGEFCERSQPEDFSKWSKESQKIHGINRKSLRNAISQRVLFDNFSSFIMDFKLDGKTAFNFVDHSNGRFDYRWIKSLFLKQGTYHDFYKFFSDNKYESTIQLARNSKYREYYKKHNLAYLCDYHSIDLDHHKAISDVNGCLELYKTYKAE